MADFHTEKYLTFVMAGEEYGIQVRRVREIVGMVPITRVPRTPKHVRGILNLRGKVVPVMDLRLKFDLPEAEYHERTCIIVVDAQGGAGTAMTGVVVDQVTEVVTIQADEIEPPPRTGTHTRSDYILGMAKLRSGLKILLDIERIVAADAIAAVATTGPPV